MDRNEEILLKKKLIDNASKIARAIPTYKLRASLTGRFWEEMEKILI